MSMRVTFGVFISGASVMIIELTGSRLMAPYIGSSVFVWTSLIGVILAFLSLGYYLGGRLSDRNPSSNSLSLIAYYAGLTTAMIALVNTPVLNIVAHTGLDIRLKAVLATAILFGIPGVLLGMVLPYCVRLNLSDIEHSGRVVGRLYAVSTAGSIVGTFLGGFFLISFFGTISIYILCGALMVFASILFCGESSKRLKWSTLMFLAVWVLLFSLRNPAAAHHATLDIDTNYHRVLIRDVVKDEVPLRMMITDPMGAQSIMNLNDPSALHSKYVRAVGDIIRNVEPKQSVLVLGGGAYSIPKFIENQFPDSSVTVVEIDEQLTEIAKKHFSFVPSSKLKIEHRDARMFLASPSLEAPQSRQKFDLIIFDVYSSSPSIPFHLVTLETFTAISAMLTQEGVIGLNVVSSVEGPASRFLRSISATIAEVFPHIDLLKVNPKLAADRVQNVLIVASSSEDSLKSAVRGLEGMSLKPEFKFPSDGTSIYRDDFAPVEWDMLAMFNNKLRLRKKEEQ